VLLGCGIAKPRNKRYEYILKHLKRLRVRPGSVVIDCACGDGYGSSILNSADMSVIGYDISEELVFAAIERGIEADISNICNLPCEDDMADVFVCSETLEHLDKQESQKAVNEIKRTTKKNGIICVTVPSDPKLCLRNKNHKQYLSLKNLKDIFSDCHILFHGEFCKKPGKCNTVVFFRK